MEDNRKIAELGALLEQRYLLKVDGTWVCPYIMYTIGDTNSYYLAGHVKGSYYEIYWKILKFNEKIVVGETFKPIQDHFDYLIADLKKRHMYMFERLYTRFLVKGIKPK